MKNTLSKSKIGRKPKKFDVDRKENRNNRSSTHRIAKQSSEAFKENVNDKKRSSSSVKADDLLVIGRKHEQLEIRKHIINGLRSHSVVPSLYICGSPGLGKTLCVKKIISDLQKEFDFNYVYSNALKLKSIASIYKHIFTKLELPKDKRSDYCTSLHRYFCEEQKKMKIVLVVDEVDMLLKGKMMHLYNLNEWNNNPMSNLILVTISNDLTIRDKLTKKINSRMSESSVQFKYYNADELLEIYQQKFEKETEEFDPNILHLLCKKVAFCSGDIRKMQQIAKLCMQLKREKGLKLVNLDVVSEAVNSSLKGGIKDVIQALSPMERNVLKLIIKLGKDSHKQEVGVKQLLEEIWTKDEHIEMEFYYQTLKSLIFKTLIKLVYKEKQSIFDNFVYPTFLPMQNLDVYFAD